MNPCSTEQRQSSCLGFMDYILDRKSPKNGMRHFYFLGTRTRRQQCNKLFVCCSNKAALVKLQSFTSQCRTNLTRNLFIPSYTSYRTWKLRENKVE